jgi:hypothetical protein
MAMRESDAVKAYRKKRYERLLGRVSAVNFDAEDDLIWATTDNGKHYAMDPDGDVLKGPPGMKGKNITDVKRNAEKKSKDRAKKEVRRTGRLSESVSKAEKRLKSGKSFSKELENVTRKTMDAASKYYDRGEESVKQRMDLRLYSNHTYEHIEMVAHKAAEAADVIEQADLGPFYKDIDRHELHAAALMHDTGMDGDSKEYASDASGDNACRKDHPINSAIHVLENREALQEAGLDPDRVALDVLAHSKSTSGIRHLTNEKEWGVALRRLEDRVNEYNESVSEEDRIHFDVSNWSDGSKDADGNYIITDKKALGSSAATAAALRLGDANRDGSEKPSTQGGCFVEIDWDSYDPSAKSAEEERVSSRVSFTDKDGTRYNLGDGHISRSAKSEVFSKGIHIGENNISSIKTTLRGGQVTEEFEIKDPTKFPYLTGEAIVERIGELNTIDGIPSKCVIKVPGISSGSSAAKACMEKVGAAWSGENAGRRDRHVDIIWEFDGD